MSSQSIEKGSLLYGNKRKKSVVNLQREKNNKVRAEYSETMNENYQSSKLVCL
jgi:hypothetical protein